MLDPHTINLQLARNARASDRSGRMNAPRSRRPRPYLAPALLFLGLVVATVTFGVVLKQKADAIRALPNEVRAQIMGHALAELRSLCVEDYGRREPLRAHCIEQARFVMLLPECGPDCRAAATVVLPRVRGGR